MKNLSIFLILFLNSCFRKLYFSENERDCLEKTFEVEDLDNFKLNSKFSVIDSKYYYLLDLLPKEKDKYCLKFKNDNKDLVIKNKNKNKLFELLDKEGIKEENFNIVELNCIKNSLNPKVYLFFPKEEGICNENSEKDYDKNNHKPKDYSNNNYNSQDYVYNHKPKDYSNNNYNSQDYVYNHKPKDYSNNNYNLQDDDKNNHKPKDYSNNNYNSQDDDKNNHKPKDYSNNNYNSQDYGNNNNNSQDYGNNNYKPKEKKSFLKHYYPNGKGRDAELIEMIEQNIIIPDFQVKFSDIAGHEKAKEILKENVILPLKLRNFFKGIRKPSRGILLYGPPGTGKTMLAKAIATTGKTTFFNVNPSTLASKYAGESEKLVKLLFEMARYYAPTTIFIDEIDSLLSQRGSMEQSYDRKVKTQFFVEIDGVQKKSKTDNKDKNIPKNVIVLAATNMPWELDEAILRRLSKRIYIPLPDRNARKLLFKLKMKGVNFSKNIDLDYLVKHTQGYNADDIGNICKEASMAPLRNYLKKNGLNNYEALKNNEKKLIKEEISNEVMLKALKNVKSSASEKFLERYKEWTKNYSST